MVFSIKKKITEQFYKNNAAKWNLAELVETVFSIACPEFDLALGTGKVKKQTLDHKALDCLDILEMKL